MEIPVYIEEEESGRLTITPRGTAALLEVRVRDPGRVVRLWLYGEGEPFYLGVPVPEGGELRLTRRLNPGQVRRLPAPPEYAGEHPRGEFPAPSHVLWMGGRPHYF